jgi:hypothetical protein
VPLGDSLQPLQDEQRSLLAAQIVYTLRQVSGVKGVLIKVNQQPYRVPGSDPNSLVISVDAIPQAMDPVLLGAGDLLYALKDGAIKQVTAGDSPTLKDLPKPLHGLPTVDALAVSVTNADLAVTTDKRTVLRHAVMASEDQPNAAQTQSRPLLSGGISNLLRPQFTRYGEIWEIGWEGGHQRMWMFDEKLKKIQINTPVLGDRVTAFRISPDGSRMALVRRTNGGGSELGLATIIRSDTIVVDKWLPVRTSQPSPGTSIASIRDVAWPNGTELLVLGAPAGAAYAPFRISQDGYEIAQQGSIPNANAVQLAVSPRRQTAIIVGDKGQTWKDDGNQLSLFLKELVSTITYPG